MKWHQAPVPDSSSRVGVRSSLTPGFRLWLHASLSALVHSAATDSRRWIDPRTEDRSDPAASRVPTRLAPLRSLPRLPRAFSDRPIVAPLASLSAGLRTRAPTRRSSRSSGAPACFGASWSLVSSGAPGSQSARRCHLPRQGQSRLRPGSASTGRGARADRRTYGVVRARRAG